MSQTIPSARAVPGLNDLSRPIIGMVHVGALPGTAQSEHDLTRLVDLAVQDARALASGGVDAILIENMHDLPYLRRKVGPEIVATMTTLTLTVREATSLPVGVQILAGANHAALATAQAAGAGFIRAESFVFAHVADEGLMDEASAGPLLRYRRHIGAQNIAVFADIKKKHASHALTADLDLGEMAHAAQFAGADAIIVTGAHTGDATDASDLAQARAACELPVLVGSGTTIDNIETLFALADGFIVGSHFKRDGDWRQPVGATRVEAFMKHVRELRRQ